MEANVNPNTTSEAALSRFLEESEPGDSKRGLIFFVNFIQQHDVVMDYSGMREQDEALHPRCFTPALHYLYANGNLDIGTLKGIRQACGEALECHILRASDFQRKEIDTALEMTGEWVRTGFTCQYLIEAIETANSMNLSKEVIPDGNLLQLTDGEQ